MASTENNLPLPRKIVVSNLPLPTELASIGNAEPAVEVLSEEVPRVSVLDGQGMRLSIFNHKSIPTSNDGHGRLALEDVPGAGIVLPGGANIYHFEIAPGYTCPIHRTTSTDYMIFQYGQVVLLTPGEAFDPATGKGEIVETICNPGDVLVQRGTLHGWVNRTSEWIRILCVVLAAEPTSTEVEGSSARLEIPDVWDV